MIKFLADESCDFAVVRALRAAGYDVLAVSERSPGAHDEDLIGLATSERRILLTEDKDFGQLVFAAGKETCGVIFIRYPAGLRSELPQRVLDAVKREGARMQTAFACFNPSACGYRACQRGNEASRIEAIGERRPGSRSPQILLAYPGSFAYIAPPAALHHRPPVPARRTPSPTMRKFLCPASPPQAA